MVPLKNTSVICTVLLSNETFETKLKSNELSKSSGILARIPEASIMNDSECSNYHPVPKIVLSTYGVKQQKPTPGQCDSNVNSVLIGAIPRTIESLLLQSYSLVFVHCWFKEKVLLFFLDYTWHGLSLCFKCTLIITEG